MSKPAYDKMWFALFAAISEKMDEVIKAKEETADYLKKAHEETIASPSPVIALTRELYARETMADLNGTLKAIAWILDKIKELENVD